MEEYKMTKYVIDASSLNDLQDQFIIKSMKCLKMGNYSQ